MKIGDKFYNKLDNKEIIEITNIRNITMWGLKNTEDVEIIEWRIIQNSWGTGEEQLEGRITKRIKESTKDNFLDNFLENTIH